MEPNRSKPSRGFISKSKLVKSFYRPTKPSNQPSDIWPNKPKSTPTPMGFIIMNQDQAFHQHTPKVAVLAVAERTKHGSYGRMESFYGEDEAVDAKAANYISRVHESFRLERVGSDRKNLEDQLV